jgi:hypothetical protein
VVLASAQGLDVSGGATVSVALPRIGAELGLRAVQLQWVMTAYSAVFACCSGVGWPIPGAGAGCSRWHRRVHGRVRASRIRMLPANVRYKSRRSVRPTPAAYAASKPES